MDQLTGKSDPGGWQRLIVPGLILALLLSAVGTFAVLFHLSALARARELLTWQVRMSAVADQQASAISDWIERHFTGLQALADNASLQIYLTQLGEGPQTGAEASAQRQYLAELLTVSAKREGFADASRSTAAPNENAPALGGLAIFGADLRPIVATGGMSWLVNALHDRLSPGATLRRDLLDDLPLPDGGLGLAFVAPIYAVDTDGAAGRPVGYVVGAVPFGRGLFEKLAIDAPYPVSASALVRSAGSMIEYLSPDGSAPVPSRRRISAATEALDTVFAVDSPGAFAEKRDFRGTPVLTTGRAVIGTSWTVVQSVPVAAAMEETNARERSFMIVAGLATLLAVASVLLAWRHGATRRLTELAGELRRLKDHYQSEHRRLESISDVQPDAITVVDRDGKVRFANRAFCERIGLARDDAIGKRLDALLGPAAAARQADSAARAIATGAEVRATCATDGAGGSREIHILAVPLDGQALVVESDVTDLLADRAARELRLSQLVRALTAAVDMRDPAAAHQSGQVASLARGVARQLQLDAATADAAEMTGRLMNFGKMLVPPELLSRDGPLSAEELARVRASLAETAGILSSAGCDGAVAEALSALTERWDGDGPDHRKGSEIPIAAQIAAAANFFVAAASARAYRRARGIGYALAEIQAEAGKTFDRRVVSALAHFVDNGEGRGVLGAEVGDD